MVTAEQLSTFPDRGSFPRELLNIGIKEYRQVFFKPYRLIYRIVGKQVVVYLIADSRRDLQSLLARRLLGSW
jgi:toxin ParE1/3/4